MGIKAYPIPSAGSIGGTLRETITSSTNNYSAPNSQVWAVVAGGGSGNTAGHVAFGYVTVQSRVVVGGVSGSSYFGSLTGVGGGTSNATLAAMTFGMTGAGGTPTGNSNLGYTASGSGGGAGIAGSGSGAAGGLGGGGGSPAGAGAVLVYY
jgi:hypothetical protein